MITELSRGWTAEVDRGPEWLIIRLNCRPISADDSPELAEAIWRLLEQQFINRLVIQLDELPLMHSYLIGELVKLHKRITSRGGVMRLCGVSDQNQEVLRICRLESRFPQYRTCNDAVRGYLPAKPR